MPDIHWLTLLIGFLAGTFFGGMLLGIVRNAIGGGGKGRTPNPTG